MKQSMTGSHFKVIQCVRYFWLIRICRGEIRHFLLSLFFYIMDNLVFINESNDVLTDSLRVAVKFEKDHSKVIRSIDDLLEKSYVIDTECNPKMDLHKMFCLCYDDIPQPNGGFRKSKRYVMNRDGFTILVMGFTGSKAIKFKLEYMNAFNEMEASIKKNLPHNYIEALEALLASEKEKQALAEAKKVFVEVYSIASFGSLFILLSTISFKLTDEFLRSSSIWESLSSICVSEVSDRASSKLL